MTMLLVEHYLDALKSKSGKIEIMTIRDLVLRVLLLTKNKVAGDQEQHGTNESKFQYVINCTTLTIFNWVEAMKVNMKHQLSKSKW